MAIPTKQNTEWWRRLLQPVKPSYWLLATRDNGNLEIYSMPDLKLVYLVTNVGNGNKVLSDSMEFVPMNQSGQQNVKPVIPDDEHNAAYANCQPYTVPKEILMIALGNYGSRPLLFIRTGSEMLIYQAYRYSKGHLKLRFRKLNHEIMSFIKYKPEISLDKDYDHQAHACQLRYFSNIAGHNGVAVLGAKSYFIFLTARGELRIHKLYDNIAMRSFAAFNNVNCPHGFLYFDESLKDELKISICPTYLGYDSIWPMRKVPLRCTAAQLTYHKERQVYCLVTDTEEEPKHYYRFNGEDKELTEDNKGER